MKDTCRKVQFLYGKNHRKGIPSLIWIYHFIAPLPLIHDVRHLLWFTATPTQSCINLGREEPKCLCPCPWHFITAAWSAKVLISKNTEIFCKRAHHHAWEVISSQDWKTKIHTNKFNSTSTRVWPVSWGHSHCKIVTATLGRLLGWPALFCHTIPDHRLGMGLVRHLLKK